MKNLVNKIVIQVLLFITSVIFGFKFVDLDLVNLTSPMMSIITWSLITMILVFDFDSLFDVKEKWLIPLVKALVFGIIALGMWRTGNTNDILVALSLITTGVLAVFVITLFFDEEDINLVDRITRYTAVLSAVLLAFDIVTGYTLRVNWTNANMLYFWMIIISQLINRVNIEYLTYNLAKKEECKVYFSEKRKIIKFSVEAFVQSGFYITLFLLISKTLESHLLTLFPSFNGYKILLCILIATAVIATHSMETKKHLNNTITSNIRWTAKFSIRILLLFFTIKLLETFSLEYSIIIGFIMMIIIMFNEFISTNLMSKRSYKLPVYLLTTFMWYSVSVNLAGISSVSNYSELAILLNASLAFIFIAYLLHMIYAKHHSQKIFRLETIGIIALITVTLSIIANTIIFGFAISVSGAFSTIGVNDFGADKINFLGIILLSGSSILAYIPVSTKKKWTTVLFTTLKWVGIFYVFNFIIAVVSVIADGLAMSNYVTMAATLVSIVIARGISEKRIKFGWVIIFGLMLIFTIELVYMLATWMNIFDTRHINFNGFRVLYTIYFLFTGFAYVYIRNMRIGKNVRVYSGFRFLTSAFITTVLFLSLVWGKPAPNMFDLNKIDDQILEDILSDIMEEFPSVDWCEVLDETGIGDQIGVNCGNYVILPEQESYANSFRDGVATEFDPHTGEWDILGSYGTTTISDTSNLSAHTSYDFEAMMDDPSIMESWFDTKDDYNVKLEIPFGAVRNTIPVPMYADLISSSDSMTITTDEANITHVSKLVKMDYTMTYRMINDVGTAEFISLLNGSSGNTSNIANGFVEVPTSMTTLINELVSEFQSLSIGQVSGDYNQINAIAAFINTKYNVISGLPQNPAAMTITDLKEFNWYENAPIEEQIDSGTLTYSSAVSLQSIMAARLNIKTRIANQLIPMESEGNEHGLFPLGVPRIEIAVPTPSGGVWTDIQVATPVPSNNSGVMVSGLSAGEDVFLRRTVVDSVVDEANFVAHEVNDFSASSGYIYGENPYGSASVSTNDVMFNVTYNPLFTSPMQLFTYGTQSYNASSNGVNISDRFGLSQQQDSILESQLHIASLPNMKETDTLKKIALNDYENISNNDNSGTTVDDPTILSIARTIHSNYEITDSEDRTVIQTIGQARINMNNHIDNVLNFDNILKETYSSNRQAFIDSIFLEYNRLLGIDLRIVTGFTANQSESGTLDANPSHMFELYVDDDNEKWIPLPDYVQSSRQSIASNESQDGSTTIDSIFDVIQGEITDEENFDDFDYIGKRASIEALNNDAEIINGVDLGVEIDITIGTNFAAYDPIFNDAVYGYTFRIIEGANLLTNVTDTTFTKIAQGDVVIEVLYIIPSTGERISTLYQITDSGFIPVIFEGIDLGAYDSDSFKSIIGNVYEVSNNGNHYSVTAYEGTQINYCAFIEMIHFVNSSKPSESANASHLVGLDNCIQEAETASYTGIYSGVVDGIGYTNLPIDFSIITNTIDPGLGGGANSSLSLAVYEGEKFNMRTFLEHKELVGVDVGSIWVNDKLLTNDEHLFEMTTNSSSESVVVNFEIDGITSDGNIQITNYILLTLRPAEVIVNSTQDLGDALNGDDLSSSLSDYLNVTVPNANIAYLDPSGGLASTPGGTNTYAPWFINHDRHDVNYDLSMVTSISGVVDGVNVIDSNTEDQVVMFVRGVWQNLTIGDLNAYLPTIDLDVDVDLQFDYQTTYTYSIDSLNIIRTNRTSTSKDFRVVDDKIEMEVNETNRTPDELSSISIDGWVVTDKLGRSVTLTVDRITTDNSAYFNGTEFYFGELSADLTTGHEFRVYATSAHSGITTEDNPIFVVNLNDVDIEIDTSDMQYYVGYLYDITSIISVTNWFGVDVTSDSTYVWRVNGGSILNPTAYRPQANINDFTISVTYASRTIDHNFTMDTIDKVTDNILPNVVASDDMEPVITTGSLLEYNFVYDERDAVFGQINICDEFYVTDIVTNSSLGNITISNTGVCNITIADSLLEEMEFNLSYQQVYGPTLSIKINVTRNKSIFDVNAMNQISSVYGGRTIAIDLTYFKTENNFNFFIDLLGRQVAHEVSDRNYKVGETVSFEYDVALYTLGLTLSKEETELDDGDRTFTSVMINDDLSSGYIYNQAEFYLVEREDRWFVSHTDVRFETINTFVGANFTPQANQLYTIKWMYINNEVYIIDYSQTMPPSQLIFYVLLTLIGGGIIGVIIWKIKTRPAKPIMTPIVEKEEEIPETITKEEEIKLIHELITDRILNLLEIASEKANSVHKGNNTWREYCNEIASNLEDLDLEVWDALIDVLERCSYYKESLEWIHFNFVESVYHELYDKFELEDKVKTKKY